MTKLIETDQYKNGKDIELALDSYFVGQGFNVRITTPNEERSLCLGDRQMSKDGERFYVEYKSGQQTAYTGNIFLETISNDLTCAPGWVYTCQAKYIIYAILLSGKMLIFKPEKLRAAIADLKTKFREAQTGKGQNDYHTHGILVPLGYAEKYLAEKVILFTA